MVKVLLEDYAIAEEALANKDCSMLKLARKLNNLHPHRSVKGWEMLMYRIKKDNEPVSDEPVNIDYTAAPYYYAKETDTYVTYLQSAGQNVVVAGEQHRALKNAYSNMASKGATINEIAREFNFPRNWFDEYKKVHGWTHDMSPYTDEEVAETPVNELVDDLLLRRRRELHKSYEKRKWKEIEDAADKWFNIEETLRVMIDGLQTNSYEVPKLDLIESDKPFCVVMSPTDFHWGKHGWVDEVGETYNFAEARSRLFERTQEILSWLPARPEKFILATGSDWFHVDNDLGTTTRGTPQDMCGSPAEILITGCKLAREHIDLLRQIAPVEVVFMSGNHDRYSSFALMLYLSASFEQCDDVMVHVNPQIRHYTTYGNTLLGFNHGDSVNKNKLPILMSKERRAEWGLTENHIWFTGHRHHQVLHEMDGGLVIQLPSLAGHDRYHYRAGYTTAKAGLAAHLIDYELGLIQSMFSPVR